MLDLLVALGDKNLVTTHERDGATRYGLLETIRQYAGERLREAGDEARWRSRHLRYLLALTQKTLEAEAVPLDVRLTQVETELDNLRAAMAWACSSPGEHRRRTDPCDGPVGVLDPARVWPRRR